MSTTLSIRPRSSQRVPLSPTHACMDDASDNDSADGSANDSAEAPVPNCAQPSFPVMTSLSSRQVSEQLNAIAQVHLHPQSFTQCLVLQAPNADSLSQLLAEPVSEDMIANQYTALCLSLWKLTQQLAQLQAHSNLSADSFMDDEATPAFSKVSFAQQQVTQRLNKLCLLWAVGKWQRPNHPFFAQSSTDFATLQAKWKNPAIQAALRQATADLLQSPQDHWITTHTDAWAYLLGNTMYQLLQWNHRLTPQYLRELLQVNEAHN